MSAIRCENLSRVYGEVAAVCDLNLEVAAGSWILAGGAHHTGFSMAVTKEHLEDFSEIAGIEYVLIDHDTTLSSIKKELRWNDLYYHLAKGL